MPLTQLESLMEVLGSETAGDAVKLGKQTENKSEIGLQFKNNLQNVHLFESTKSIR